ncbi:hypothetical protein N0V91_005731 [Didymella pomorum]|uniref:Uncharacterized protein n=1 Tax=Didymella pomorum TaxID=749634 RepID=A0A9W9D875_9PLEO|nr:hypothetical protein N0V91_005731 [Didymella pomorum]
MDAEPNCAICSAPNHAGCVCESERLQIALDQAESRAMDARLADIREWVLAHARHHIQLAFQRLTTIRQHAQTAYLNSLPHYDVYMRFSGAPPIHPLAIAQLQSQIAEAHAEFKRGIDLDWRASVLRYPEVLDYFYSLVDLRLPADDDRKVLQPPFAAAGYQDRGYVGESSRVGSEKPKKKKRRDSAGMGRMERIRYTLPPEVPSPPTQHPGYGGPGYGGPMPGAWGR